MYPEFIPIYVGILIIIGMLAYIIVMLKTNTNNVKEHTNTYTAQSSIHKPETTIKQNSGNIVFCKKCATEFDASLKVCPNCGTPR